MEATTRMQHLFTTEGEAALAAILRKRPLLAFDFDGTLAPIVERPDDARISRRAAARLGSLAARLPVAIVTGRAVEDVRGRLGFEPRYVVGSHGAEDGLDPAGAELLTRALDPLRDLLRARGAELAAGGVLVEDKGQSVALHYRLAHRRSRALALIHDLLAQPGLSLHSFAGKMVVNITGRAAPDKAHAVHALVARCGASCALFAGDDVNDEPVFVSAPPDWLTVRVGRDDPASRAKFFVDSPVEMALLLERMLTLVTRTDPV
jgi:trehalose 6-phosphate phosphatase